MIKDKPFVFTPDFPIEREAAIPTLDKPLIIESACPGWQEGGKRFPAVPCSIEDQIKEIVDSVKAGAVAVHVHPRNPKTCKAESNTELLKEILDGVFAEVGICLAINHTWTVGEDKIVDYISHTDRILELGQGNKYCQGAVVLPPNRVGMSGGIHKKEQMVSGVKYLEENDIKPVFQLHDTYTHYGFKHDVFDHGICKSLPYLLSLNLGKHHSHAVHKDPWSYFQLISNYHMVKETIPESIIGIDVGGRNWLPLTTLGILMGAQFVRVGIEDSYWQYPHQDKIIQKNSEVIETVVNIATLLGRQVVRDPEEARAILGMKLTS